MKKTVARFTFLLLALTGSAWAQSKDGVLRMALPAHKGELRLQIDGFIIPPVETFKPERRRGFHLE